MALAQDIVSVLPARQTSGHLRGLLPDHAAKGSTGHANRVKSSD